MTGNPLTDTPIRVVAICGSIREGSYTRMAADLALKGAQELGATTKLIDLRDYELAFCDGKEDESIYPDGVFRLREEIRQAQGILLATPEYHGSFSGVLKNALDLMGFEEFEGKMLGLLGVSGGRMGAIHALNSLRSIGRSLHAWVLPDQVSIPQAWKVFDEDGEAQNEELSSRLMELGRQVARFAYLHLSEQAREFMRLWEEAPPNPGGNTS